MQPNSKEDSSSNQSTTETYQVHGMTCNGCRKKIDETLNAITGISAEVNLDTHTATISSTNKIDLDAINRAFAEKGDYSLQPNSKEDSSSNQISTEIFQVHGMTCNGCRKKIEETLNAITGISAEVDLDTHTATISSTNKIDLDAINRVLTEKGDYSLHHSMNDSPSAKKPPQERVSPSNTYYCPMECEGDKVYHEQGLRCPECNMYLVPIEEKVEQANKASEHAHAAEKNITKVAENAGKYYCPMFCEGDKVYDSNVGCPVCGMDLVRIPAAGENAEDDTAKNLSRKFWIALAFTIPVFILSMGGMWIHWPFSAKTQGILELLFTLPVLFYAGWFLMVRGWRSFATWNLNMFSLISLGVSAAFIFSMVVLFAPEILPEQIMQQDHAPYYFEAVSVILTLVILGQWLEARAHNQTGKAIEALMNLAPETATVIREGEEMQITISEIEVGDKLRIRPGDKIAVDGKILTGNSHIDESMITGEPIPVEKQAGDTVISGTLNTSGSFTMSAEQVGDNTTLSKIIEMVNEATRSRAPIQRLVDRVSAIFVPAVIVVAILTFIVWWTFGGENNLTLAVVNAVAVLIVACPCALGLATPMSMMVGIGKGAQNGVLVKNAQALESMQKMNILLTDKTGTLTEGKPVLAEIYNGSDMDDEQFLLYAASLNQNSEHPLAKAVLQKFAAEYPSSQMLEVEGFENIAGQGVKAQVNNKNLLLGNEKMLKTQNINLSEEMSSKFMETSSKGMTTSYMVLGNEVLGFLAWSDTLKKSAKDAVNFLKNEGVEVVMVTGDNEQAANAVAAELGIEKIIAQALPEDKIALVQQYHQDGKIVGMTGDGINDAPALAGADVGIAMGTGSDAAIESADITLVKGDILGVAKAHILSRKLLQNIKQNLFFAFIYNVLGIPIAAGILYPFFGTLMSPMIAAAAMSFSSVSVILNSLRLNKAHLTVEDNK
ncbi:MAG: heavy metal translocating P-type ATPase [Weeksellaceae bacterium]|nr:heavy metal translocating P-type ATPase [Weeksellaceae bacterium]